MNAQFAEETFRELRESYTRINACVVEVFEQGSYAQAVAFRKLAGELMGGLVLDFFRPLRAEHPQLEPEALKSAEACRVQPLPESVAQGILATVSELETRLQRLDGERLAALPPEEAARYREGSAGLLSRIELARAFVARATRG